MSNLPAVLAHFDQYQANVLLLPHIGDEWVDWRITVRFYAALHLFNSYHKRMGGIDFKTHEQRDRYIKNTPHFKPIARAYLSLAWLSRVTRYDCCTVSFEDLQHLEPESKKCLQDIENYMLYTINEYIQQFP